MEEKSFLSFADYDLLPSVREFLSGTLKNFIDGEWSEAKSGKTFEKREPATNDIVTNAAESGPEDVDLAVAAARRAFENPAWRDMPTSQRQNIMLRFADLLEEHKIELNQLECMDNGQTTARTMGIDMAANFVRYYAGLSTKVYGDTMEPTMRFPGMNIHSYTLRQPVGVVAAIIPWNGPILMWISKVAPAIAMGCTIVMKPPVDTPIAAVRLMQLLQEAGLPKGVVNLILGYGEVVGAYLAAHPGINKVTFTGSTEVGMSIGRSAMGNMTRVSLELGGKSPSIIFDDADMASAPMQAATSIFMNAGQICVAGSRLFVQEKKFDHVMAAIQQRARTLKVGPGMDPTNEMGPLINPRQKARILDYIESGIEAGARLLAGGKGIDRPGNFVQPTVFVDVDDQMRIYREEIFGPVLVASPFRDIEDVVQRANDTNYGLAANIWTSNIQRAHRMAQLIDAGTITINGSTLPDPNLPFGGFKHSGIGRENAKSTIDLFTEIKTVSILL